MKFVAKFILFVVAIYVTAWLALAAYFSVAERHKELLESSLTSIFKRPVSIAQVQTGWDGFSPAIQITDFKVAGDTPQQPVLSFATLSAKIDPWSILLFWPQFSEIAIDKPELEIANISASRMRIAGFELNSNSSLSISPKTVISWALNHEQVVWHDGTVVRRRLDGSIVYYSDISFVYERSGQDRITQATVNLPDGRLAFKTMSHGDVINSDNWDASLEVLTDEGESLLSSDDLSLNVIDGKGQLLLKKLGVQQIRDFLQLTGMLTANNWILESQLGGQLSDVQFDFFGAFLNFSDWSFKASATQVSFESTGSIPAMTNLNGAVVASSAGGVFDFATSAAQFSWPRWFDNSLAISAASGQFQWDMTEQDKVTVKLDNGLLSDQVSHIHNLTATVEIDTSNNRIRSIADLFKVESLQDLTFDQGDIVNQTQLGEDSFAAVFLDASADVDVSSLAAIRDYFPNDPRIAKFDEWWANAMLLGQASNGRISYQGSVTKSALYDGNATLTGQIDFSDVMLDFGYQQDWPVLSKGRGVARIDNATVTFLPDEAWLQGDRVGAAKVMINSVFRNDRDLTIEASLQSDLPKVMDFLFAGPLLKPQQRILAEDMPVTAEQGDVETEILVTIPLNKIRETQVIGTARVTNGTLILPEGMPVTGIRGQVSYTENSAEANNIQGQFLGGAVSAKLTTLTPAQPPKLELTAIGKAKVEKLEPWIGEHLLTWMQGETDWQGSIVTEGPSASILIDSQLLGVTVNAPPPLAKAANDVRPISVDMQLGKDIGQSLKVEIGDDVLASFRANKDGNNHLLDRSIISLGGSTRLREGINFDIRGEQIDLDAWLGAVIDLAQFKTSKNSNTLFLDSMRSVNISTGNPKLLGRQFGAFELSAVSRDGMDWIGSLSGDNIDGIIEAQPRAETANYRLNLSKLHLPEGPKEKPPLDPIDSTLLPQNYPIIDLNINSFRFVTKQLGHLRLRGEPLGDVWQLSNFDLNHQGINTTAQGQWVNSPATGTITNFDIETTIDEAGGALQELDMDGMISRGDGSLKTSIKWIGAPHEFDYSRLNGEFDLRIDDGELVNIEPGGGKLLGLFNFNAIARRLTLDFRDIFSSGLEFDRMRYTGIFADGQAIMREAYVFTPAVFVTMEGKLDLDQEMIDMEIHMSPELGGNLTLLSALANPAAGAVVFLTQQIFKDEMRAASFKSYRALGPWDDFEMVEFDLDDQRRG